MKKIAVILCVLLIALLVYLAHGYLNLKLQSAAADRTRAELDGRYQAQLAEYQHSLRIGTSRAEVKRYLDSRKVAYSEWQRDLMVNLGREPDVFPCDYWTVYVSFEFGHEPTQEESQPADPLGAVSLKRIGHCL